MPPNGRSLFCSAARHHSHYASSVSLEHGALIPKLETRCLNPRQLHPRCCIGQRRMRTASAPHGRTHTTRHGMHQQLHHGGVWRYRTWGGVSHAASCVHPSAGPLVWCLAPQTPPGRPAGPPNTPRCLYSHTQHTTLTHASFTRTPAEARHFQPVRYPFCSCSSSGASDPPFPSGSLGPACIDAARPIRASAARRHGHAPRRCLLQ